MLKRLGALFHPDRYHGWGRKKQFFEGWYFKLVSPDENHALAIIPGVAMDENENRQAFVQVLNGKHLKANYHKFDFKTFKSAGNKFSVNINNNYFHNNAIHLDLPNLKGSISFQNLTPWPSTWYSPGIMGPFSFVPMMECYHGVLSMQHQLSGILKIDGKEVDFTGGKGYTEKDWGHSFPEGYCWMQSNHFNDPGISLKLSVAKIPWMGSSFVGFIAGIIVNNKLIEFTTYNGAKLLHSEITNEGVQVTLKNKAFQLDVFVKRQASTALASPVRGFMDGRIEESMSAEIQVTLTDIKAKQVVLKDTGRNGCLEVAGNIQLITVYNY